MLLIPKLGTRVEVGGRRIRSSMSCQETHSPRTARATWDKETAEHSWCPSKRFFFFSLRYSARDSVSGSSDTVSSVSSWSSWTSHWLESCDYCPTGSSLCFLRLEGWRQEAWELCFHFLRNGTLEKWGSGKKAFCLDLPYLEGTEGSVSFSSLGPASDSDWPLMNQGFWRLLLFQQSNTVNFFLIPRASFLLKCSWSWETYWYIITNN